MITALSIVIGLLALVPVWAVGRWVTRYDHPNDHRDVAWNIFAGVMVLGALTVVGLIVYAVGRAIVAAVWHR